MTFKSLGNRLNFRSKAKFNNDMQHLQTHKIKLLTNKRLVMAGYCGLKEIGITVTITKHTTFTSLIIKTGAH